MNPVVVRRSAVRMWLIAVLAVPFVLYGTDVLLERRFVTAVLELMHPDGELPAVETRDLAWAWVFVLVGGGIALWALKELVLPRKLIEADEERMTLRLGGPLAKPAGISWPSVKQIRASRASDDGDVFPVMVVEFLQGAVPRGIPSSPWGARWVEPTLLAISARDWDKPVTRVVELLRGLIGLTRSRARAPAEAETADRPGEPSALPRTEPVPDRSTAGPEPEAGEMVPDDEFPSADRSHWSDVASELQPDMEEQQPQSLHLPQSRFSASHWIILEEGEDR